MLRREKEILLTLSSIGAAGLLIYFFNNNEAPSQFGEIELGERSRRGAIVTNFCFDDVCEPDAIDDDADDDILMDDVMMFQSEPEPPQDARKRGKGKGKGKNKGGGGGGRPPKVQVDNSGLWKSDDSKQIMDDAVDKATSQLDRWHQRQDTANLAKMSEGDMEHEKTLDMFDVSPSAQDFWSAAAAAGDNDCSLSSDNRISSTTQSVLYLFPQDIMYDSDVDQDQLMAAYRSFGVALGQGVNDGTKFAVGNYNTQLGKPSMAQVESSSNSGAAIDALQTKFNVPSQTKKGQQIIKIVQMKQKSLLGFLTSTSIKNRFFRRADDGESQTCQAFIIFHGLPTDYKDIVGQSEDYVNNMMNYQERCNIVPIFITNEKTRPFFDFWAANFRGLTNSLYTAMDQSFRGYIVTTPAEFIANAENLANHMISYACTCENRQTCLLAKSGFVEEIEISAALTTAATTTEGTTTSMFSTTTTSGFSTTDDGFRGIDTTEPIPEDKRCCGYSGDLSAYKYDRNRQFCCNDGDAFYVSDEVC